MAYWISLWMRIAPSIGADILDRQDRLEKRCSSSVDRGKGTRRPTGRLSVIEQSAADFPGFSRPLTSVEGRSTFGSYCTGFEDGLELGPVMCFSMQMEIPVSAPDSAAYGFGVSGPAIAIVPGFVCFILSIVWLGFLFGFYRARRKTFQGRVPDLSLPGSYDQWRYERNTTILTFILVATGLAFFAFGVSGSVELRIPYARVITSAPGVVAILFGYLFWIRRHSFRRQRNNEEHPKAQGSKADSDL